MGGVSRRPGGFAAAIAICGYTSRTRKLAPILEDYEGFAAVPFRVFHNVWDPVVAYRHSSTAVKKLESCGAGPYLRLAHGVDNSGGAARAVLDLQEEQVPGVPHIFSDYKIYIRVHGNLYENPVLYRWLLGHSRS